MAKKTDQPTEPTIDQELAEEFNLSEDSMYDEGAPKSPKNIKRLIIILLIFLLLILTALGAFIGYNWYKKRMQKDDIIESELLKTISLTYRFEETEPIAVSNIRNLASKKFGQELVNETEETEIIYNKAYAIAEAQGKKKSVDEYKEKLEAIKFKQSSTITTEDNSFNTGADIEGLPGLDRTQNDNAELIEGHIDYRDDIGVLYKTGDSSTENSYFGNAINYFREGRYYEAIKEFEKSAKTGRKIESLMGIAKCYNLEENYKRALHIYNMIIEETIDVSVMKEALFCVAEIYFNSGNKNETFKTIKKLCEIDSEYINAKLGIA